MQFERLTGGRHAATLKKAYEVIASRAVSKPPKFVLLNRAHTFGIRLAAGKRLAHLPKALPIGYSGLGYKTAGVRTVALAAPYGKECYDTTVEATYSSKYPIARYLYIYLNKKPNERFDPLRAEFIKYVLSEDGQTQTEKGGFFPITNEIRAHDLEALGISILAN
jgi:hypothetical protein